MAQQRILNLTEEERRELEDRRDHARHPFVRERCGALLKIAGGMSAHAVAKTGLLKPRDPDTVYKWLRNYEEFGIQSVEMFQQGGAHRRGL